MIHSKVSLLYLYLNFVNYCPISNHSRQEGVKFVSKQIIVCILTEI